MGTKQTSNRKPFWKVFTRPVLAVIGAIAVIVSLVDGRYGQAVGYFAIFAVIIGALTLVADQKKHRSTPKLTPLQTGEQRKVGIVVGNLKTVGLADVSEQTVLAVLIPETDNHYDPNAVRVDIETSKGRVIAGYLPTDIGRDYSGQLQYLLRSTGRFGSCPAIVTSQEGKNHKIEVVLNSPQTILPITV